MRVALHEAWTVRAVGGEVPDDVAGRKIPATVPGCVHLDLLAAGLIADPYLDENEFAIAWIGRADWRYETTFAWTGNGDDRIDLIASGLDTVATIELNGSVVAWTENMHRSYRFPVADLLKRGANELSITFASALTAAELASEKLGPRPHVNAHPFNAIRKMACTFGGNGGPELVTAGIWRPLRVETWRTARFASVRPLVYVDGTTGLLRMHIDVERAADDGPLVVEVDVAGTRTEAILPASGSSVVVEVSVDDVRLWWPHGYGAQPLYPVVVTLCDQRGQLDCWDARVGFRTVALDTAPDERGTPFTLLVNGTPVFARGVNWIPDDCFPSRVTRERYVSRLGQARDANANLVRVWGGGIYENKDFYDACDELGLLVWQDFLFACAAYAEEEPLRSEVEAEAREAVTRLCPHPSLVLWNGGKENMLGHEDRDWQESLGDRTWGWGYYTDLLPSIVAELDPTRPYSPGIPYSISPDLAPTLVGGLAGQLPAPQTIEDRHWATSLDQARAVAFGVEQLRSSAPVCMGTVMWQLNDCWPVTSWAAIDSDGRRKPLWYALRRSYADRLLTLQPRDGQLALVVVNDSARRWSTTAEISRRSFDGTVLASIRVPLDVEPRGKRTVRVPEHVVSAGDPTRELLLAEAGARRAWWPFVEDVEAALSAAEFDTHVTPFDEGYCVTVTARTLIRDLALLADRVAPDAVVDNMLVTLLPGESVTFETRTAAELTHEQLVDPLVLRSANQLITDADR